METTDTVKQVYQGSSTDSKGAVGIFTLYEDGSIQFTVDDEIVMDRTLWTWDTLLKHFQALVETDIHSQRIAAAIFDMVDYAIVVGDNDDEQIDC